MCPASLNTFSGMFMDEPISIPLAEERAVFSKHPIERRDGRSLKDKANGSN